MRTSIAWIFSSFVMAGCVWGQTAAPAFEAASVRVTPKASFGYTVPGTYGTNRYTVTNATLSLLVQLAYGVPDQQIAGAEKLGSDHYDVAVKAEDGVMLTYEVLRPRLRQLLEERFRLRVHRDSRESDGYALVVAKGGPKLHPTGGSKETGMIYPGGLRLMNMPLAGFATMLRSTAGKPVEDRTGIAGNYDFEMKYAREGDTKSDAPSFFTALQEQLGLKLVTGKVPLEIVVVDSVERVPSEN